MACDWRLTLAAAATFGVAVLPSSIHAQSITQGALAGTVQDEVGVGLFEVDITVVEQATGMTRLISTPRTGSFTLAHLPPGRYSLLVERLGYAPLLIRDVPVSQGRTTRVPVVLREAPAAVVGPDTISFDGAEAGGSRVGVSQAIPTGFLRNLPDHGRELGDVLRLTTWGDPDGTIEGLPGHLNSTLVDGLPFRSARHPGFGTGADATAAFARSFLLQAELLGNDVDVELGGFAGSVLAASTRRGTAALGASAFGDFASGALVSSDGFGPGGPPDFAGVRGGGTVSAGLIGDTARVIAGLEIRRADVPVPPSWPRERAEPAAAAAQSLGIGVDDLLEPSVAGVDAASGFGRLDWQVQPRHAVVLRGNFASITEAAPWEPRGSLPATSTRASGTDASVGAAVYSQMSRETHNELRVSLSSSTRDYDAAEATSTPNPHGITPTWIAGTGLPLGGLFGGPASFTRMGLHAINALQLRTRDGLHQVKLGVSLDHTRHEQDFRHGMGGEFVFGGAADLAAVRGIYHEVAGPPPISEFTTTRAAAFLQDTWNVAPGFFLVLGGRLDHDRLPVADARSIVGWTQLTETTILDIPTSVTRFAPRAAFRWDPTQRGAWILRGSAGVYHDEVDPAILGELVYSGDRYTTRRAIGALSGWPGTPAEVQDAGQTLTVLAPALRGPRSRKGSLGLSFALGAGAELQLSGLVRRTDFLPRRGDLNRLHVPVGVDQHGRAVFGRLVQAGSTLAAEVGTNRRFENFDHVWGISVDGTSDHTALTLALERVGERLGFFTRYTWSSTEDNWVGAGSGRPEAGLSPLPGTEGGGGWAEGTSDFDVPHRALLGATYVHPGRLAPTLAVAYRFRSGLPFTPGYPHGVDVNGDGAWNDPAAIDPDIPGTSDHIREWDCLRTQAGTFASRNSCREDNVHSLDLRVGVRIAESGRYSAGFFLDALNVIGTEYGIIDTALYLVDPSGEVTFDPSSGRFDVPLVANPGFGELIARRDPGSILRLGLSVEF